MQLGHGHDEYGNEFMTYPKEHSPIYESHSKFGEAIYYPKNPMQEYMLGTQSMTKNLKSAFGSDMESDLLKIMALLTTENYIVAEMNDVEIKTRLSLFNRIRKWMIKIHLRGDVFEKFSESLHLQFVREKRRQTDNERINKPCFIFCCPICMEVVKIAELTMFLKNGSDGNYFSLSNVIRHLRKKVQGSNKIDKIGRSKKYIRKLMAEYSESDEEH